MYLDKERHVRHYVMRFRNASHVMCLCKKRDTEIFLCLGKKTRCRCYVMCLGKEIHFRYNVMCLRNESHVICLCQEEFGQ
jgi:hypothetical protein